MTEKTCRVCAWTGPPKDFGPKKGSLCDRCYREADRNQKCLSRYGITYQQKVEIVRRQDFRCPICLKKINPRSAHVDHCHDSGKVRGCLCRACNTGIARLGDGRDNSRFERARLYCEGTL